MLLGDPEIMGDLVDGPPAEDEGYGVLPKLGRERPTDPAGVPGRQACLLAADAPVVRMHQLASSNAAYELRRYLSMELRTAIEIAADRV